MPRTLTHIPDVSVFFSSLLPVSVVFLTSQLPLPHAIPGVWYVCMLLHSLLSQGMYPSVYKIKSITVFLTINLGIKKVQSTLIFKQMEPEELTSLLSCLWKFKTLRALSSIWACTRRSSGMVVGKLLNCSIRWAIRAATLEYKRWHKSANSEDWITDYVTPVYVAYMNRWVWVQKWRQKDNLEDLRTDRSII